MMNPQGANGVLRFSTEQLPAQERLPFWREEFGRRVIRLDIDTEEKASFEAAAELRGMPGLGMLDCRVSPNSSFTRTKQSIKDGNDDIVVFVTKHGSIQAAQKSNAFAVRSGEAFCIRHAEEASINATSAAWTALMLSNGRLSGLLSNIEDALAHAVSRNSEPLGLLRSYLEVIRASAVTEPALKERVTAHVYELVALTLGASRDGRHVAMSGGVRAARLHALKGAVLKNPNVSLSDLARQHRITSRYVQILFEESGCTFTDFVTERRLQKAFWMLCEARFDGLKIATIAMQCGFGDLSHFNRCFKRRFEATPTEIRMNKKS